MTSGMWRPMKEEIKSWLDMKEDEFSHQETKNLRVNHMKQKDKYIYFDLHEILFAEFPFVLFKWVKRQR